MRLVVHWSICVVEDRRFCVRWAEYAFRELPLEDRRRTGLWRHYRCQSVGVPVKVPIGSRIVSGRGPSGTEERLAVYWDATGLTAESVASLAHRGERGFRYASPSPEKGGEVARRRGDDGPNLFGEPEPAGQGAYSQPSAAPGRAVVREPVPRAELAAIAREVLVEERGEIAAAARRALAEIEAAIAGEDARIVTARAILQAALGV